ncbi:unnamed protein product [Medioppia subpectinata]|uniref:DNA primase large subunit n=1 Tax=Medioppia subpectinata TaxID=1979941 RepID=A0A7R9PV85_9ACAR|nr:unnamed protein product [Medioppia subpectinata]CAG2101601.1 unnamed protein product [Medioppia subpectinata]
MQFNENRENRRFTGLGIAKESTHVTDARTKPYESCINFYTIPPFGKISLEESEDLVAERLNLLMVCDEMLKGLEKTANRKRSKPYFESLENRLISAESKYEKNLYLGSKTHSKSTDLENARRRDQISHFLLRMYYCRSDELKRWFISRECEILRVRLMDPKIIPELPSILSKNGFNFEPISGEERNSMNQKINWNQSLRNSADAVVYRIPFEESLDAIRNRKVYLNNGFAYIMVQDMLMQLSLHQLEEDQRLIPRLHSMHTQIIDNRNSSVKTEDELGREIVRPQMIDSLSKESFPPCMQNIHEILRKEHHLKYYGRVHYGLFLRGIGLTLEDALDFFREEFIKKTTPEKFQKEYSYGIRYNYGKEGRKVAGMAYGCSKIINNNPPGVADTHGCPFKHFDANHLKQFLRKHDIKENESNEIGEIVEKEQDHVKACSKYFSCKHQWYPEISFNHPNQYYKESRKAFKMSSLTPPESGQLVNDMSAAETTVDSLDESVFETEDEFDRSVAAMDLDVTVTEPVVNIDVTDTEPMVTEPMVSTDDAVIEPLVNTDVMVTEPVVNSDVTVTEPVVSIDVMVTEPVVNSDVTVTEPVVSIDVTATEPVVNTDVSQE